MPEPRVDHLGNIERRFKITFDVNGRPARVDGPRCPEYRQHGGFPETVEVAPVSQHPRGAVEEHRAFVGALTKALNDHGVPAMPSWREAIDWLAAHGSSSR